jgi:hypothetical protein
MPLDAGMWRFDVNTAAAEDFSSYRTPLTMYPTGDVGLGGNLKAPGAIYSEKPLTPDWTSNSPTPADSKLLLYDFGGGNWAGIGVDTGGYVWIRAGWDQARQRLMKFSGSGLSVQGLSVQGDTIISAGGNGVLKSEKPLMPWWGDLYANTSSSVPTDWSMLPKKEECKMLLYDFGGDNWAGIGVSAHGHIWLRVGTSWQNQRWFRFTPGGMESVSIADINRRRLF